MEIQNTDVTIVASKRTPKRALPPSSAMPENLNNYVMGRTAGDGQQNPFRGAVADLDAEIDLDLLAWMQHLTRQKTVRMPGAAEKEAAGCPAPTKNLRNIAPRVRVRRSGFGRPMWSSTAWVIAILAVLAFLTLMLMMGIAVSV
jgi:hypothetical protein